MSDLTFKDISVPEPLKDMVSLEPRVKPEPKEIKVEKTKLSDNIQNFDKKITKAKVVSPYDYNVVAFAPKKSTDSSSMTASQLLMSPIHNTVGKFLGIDTRHEWNRDYDKVSKIVEWAKTKSGKEDTNEVLGWLSGAAMTVPSLGATQRKIDQLYLYARLQS